MLYARQGRRRVLFGAVVLLLALTLWGTRHLGALAGHAGPRSPFEVVFALAFGVLAVNTVLFLFERPYRVTEEQQAELNMLRVTVPVPCYNEDPALLKACLWSLIAQTRKPQQIYVVDDGSSVDYTDVRDWFYRQARFYGITPTWKRTPNAGKRQAQGHAFRATGNATDIFLTVDSDADLAPDAMDELLKPFGADKRIQSVAGIVLAQNNRVNLLARITDFLFVTGQLVDRSAASTMGSVLVNSGVLAAYRRDLIIDNMDGYLNETFCGRPVEFSDDSMLTLYALERGRAVQQPSSFAFTAMPVNLSHHWRQYLRWMRGATIRTVWRFRYLPLNSFAYWHHLVGWLMMAMSTVVFFALFIVYPISSLGFSPWLLFVPAMVAYAQGLRYMTLSRSDESVWSQLITFALAPLAMFWSYFALRGLRWYAMSTCWKTGSWGTRQDGVEVKATA